MTTISIIIFSRLYFFEYPQYSDRVWSRDLVEAINYAENSQYDCILMNERQYVPVYILILFYTNYSPQKYHLLPSVNNKVVSWQIDRYQIIYLANLEKIKKTCLFLAKPKEIQFILDKGFKVKPLHTISDRKNNISYEIIEMSPTNIIN